VELKEGQQVWLSCTVTEGMFPTEKLVEIQIVDEKAITGFIPTEDIVLNGPPNGWVRAVLRRVRPDEQAWLWFRGELLSRTNPVAVPFRWVSDNSLDDPRIR
jgi:hypothetical protein